MKVVALLEEIKVMNEDALWAALKQEMAGDARPYVMSRIYGRASCLRAERERVEMAQATVNAN